MKDCRKVIEWIQEYIGLGYLYGVVWGYEKDIGLFWDYVGDTRLCRVCRANIWLYQGYMGDVGLCRA